MTLEEALDACPLIAILRGVTPPEAVAICEALHEAGIRAVEIPLNSPRPLESIALVSAAAAGRMIVGAGTVLTTAEVDAVRAAGGAFIVSPNTDPAVIAHAVALGLPPLPGFATASEAFAALAAGARHLKLFPAATYGPEHLKALRAVLPAEVRVYPVGGVGPAQFDVWREAGAAGFGLGSTLYAPGQSADVTLAKATACVSPPS